MGTGRRLRTSSLSATSACTSIPARDDDAPFLRVHTTHVHAGWRNERLALTVIFLVNIFVHRIFPSLSLSNNPSGPAEWRAKRARQKNTTGGKHWTHMILKFRFGTNIKFLDVVRFKICTGSLDFRIMNLNDSPERGNEPCGCGWPGRVRVSLRPLADARRGE